jgi:hypothetical protein
MQAAWRNRGQYDRNVPSARARKWLLVVCLMLAWPTAGCGRAPALASGRVLRISLSEYRLSPRNTRAGAGPLTILVHNYGRFPHNLALSAGGHPLGSTKAIWPGESADLTLVLPRGKYLMASTVFSDQALGVFGTLSVLS